MSVAPTPMRPAVVTLVATAVLLCAVLLMTNSLSARLTAEGGVIETLSAGLYFLAFAALIIKVRHAWPFAIVLLAFGLRELDMDKIPFTKGLLKSRQYIGDAVPTPEKIIAAIILITILVAVFLAIKRGFKPFVLGLKNYNGIAWSVALALIFGTTAKTVDGIGRKLAEFGISASDTLIKNAAIYEETTELGMSLGLLLATVAFIKHTQTHT